MTPESKHFMAGLLMAAVLIAIWAGVEAVEFHNSMHWAIPTRQWFRNRSSLPVDSN